MRIMETRIQGVYVIDIEPRTDERGFFARCWDIDQLRDAGLETDLHLSAITFNPHKGTLRGMHFQTPPFAEAKFVRVTRGAIFDVAIDLRKDSSTYMQWCGQVLSADNRKQLYIPKGCAHGYLTLEPDSELTYFLSAPFSADHARGVRFNDPRFQIEWPGEVRVISQRDANYPDYVE